MKTALNRVPTFIPGSKMAYEIPELVLDGIERFPYALDELGQWSEKVSSISTDDFNTEVKIASLFKERFNFYGSDKSDSHDYHLIYGQIIAELGLNKALNVLEIGIGSIDPSIPSNMGRDGHPGASLRAFRDVLPKAQIYGADIDSQILFRENRIRTSIVDQMTPLSFQNMHASFGQPSYDLIIDDGLHAVSANLNSLLFSLPVLRPGGWMVIEDIWAGKICWHTVYRLLDSSQWDKFLIRIASGCHAFVLQKK